MTKDWILRIEEICMNCREYSCCDGSCPPITKDRYDILIKNGVSPDHFEFEGYWRLKIKNDNMCALFRDGKCSVHNIKPETCQAGPFTFDIKNDEIEIYLKYESLCPIVRVLKEVPEAFNEQFSHAVEQISNLVSRLSKNELRIICMIDEPLTEKVADIPGKLNCKL